MVRASRPELKEAIIRVSVELGSQLGEEGLTMRAIAKRLGISATALYQHFDSKAAILQEIRLYGLRLDRGKRLQKKRFGHDAPRHFAALDLFVNRHGWLMFVSATGERCAICMALAWAVSSASSIISSRRSRSFSAASSRRNCISRSPFSRNACSSSE